MPPVPLLHKDNSPYTPGDVVFVNRYPQGTTLVKGRHAIIISKYSDVYQVIPLSTKEVFANTDVRFPYTLKISNKDDSQRNGHPVLRTTSNKARDPLFADIHNVGTFSENQLVPDSSICHLTFPHVDFSLTLDSFIQLKVLICSIKYGVQPPIQQNLPILQVQQPQQQQQQHTQLQQQQHVQQQHPEQQQQHGQQKKKRKTATDADDSSGNFEAERGILKDGDEDDSSGIDGDDIGNEWAVRKIIGDPDDLWGDFEPERRIFKDGDEDDSSDIQL